MDLSSGLGSPVGHCGQTKNFTRLAVASETHAERMAKGLPFKCPRGAGGNSIEPKLCALWWRAKVAPCLSEYFGLCNIGEINDAKFPEDIPVKQTFPDDLTKPTFVDGVKFIPAEDARRTEPPAIVLRASGNLVLNKAAVQQYGLGKYTHARLAMSEDGKAIGIKFLTEARPGSRLLQNHGRSGYLLSHRPFVEANKKNLGIKALLQATSWDGFYVARFGGEEA